MKYSINSNPAGQLVIGFIPENHSEKKTFTILYHYHLAVREYNSKLLQLGLDPSKKKFRHDLVKITDASVPAEVVELKSQLNRAVEFSQGNKFKRSLVKSIYNLMLLPGTETTTQMEMIGTDFVLQFLPDNPEQKSLSSAQLDLFLSLITNMFFKTLFDKEKLNEIKRAYADARRSNDADTEYDSGFDSNTESPEIDFGSEKNENDLEQNNNNHFKTHEDAQNLEEAWQENQLKETVEEFAEFVRDETVKQVVTQMNNLSVSETTTDKNTKQDSEKVFQGVYKKFTKHSFFGLNCNEGSEASTISTAEEADKALQTARKDASFTTTVQNNLNNALGVRRANNTPGSCNLIIPRSRL